MNIKILLTSIFLFTIVSSCKVTSYSGYIGQGITTEINLSEANFKVLGSFIGTATAKKAVWNIRDRTGIISDAKKDLLESASKAGVELKGARALINVTTDIVQNSNRLTCTMSAEIIEFTK